MKNFSFGSLSLGRVFLERAFPFGFMRQNDHFQSSPP